MSFLVGNPEHKFSRNALSDDMLHDLILLDDQILHFLSVKFGILTFNLTFAVSISDLFSSGIVDKTVSLRTCDCNAIKYL